MGALRQKLEALTDGALCIEVFHSAQLGEEKNSIEETQIPSLP